MFSAENNFYLYLFYKSSSKFNKVYSFFIELHFYKLDIIIDSLFC